MKFSLKPSTSSHLENKQTRVTILAESSKLSVKELEKITDLISENLQTFFGEKTIEISQKELRASSGFEIGTKYSVSVKFQI